MRWSLFLLALILAVAGCQPQVEAPPLPLPPPEDLSTWTVPELVQPPPPAPPAPQSAAPGEDKPTAAEKVYTYAPGTSYTVQVPVGWPLDIILEPGEQLRNYAGGDRAPTGATPSAASQPSDPEERIRAAVSGTPPTPPQVSPSRRWDIKEGDDGMPGDTQRHHVFLTASEPGMTTGFVLTTTRRTYYLTCQSVKTSPIRVLRWHYPTSPPVPPPEPALPRLLPDPGQPARYHVGYQVEAHGRVPDWRPRFVLDDGRKLYIVYPEVTLFGSVPVVRKVGPNGPQLVNARQFLNVIILDELVAQAELRVGTGINAETVTITRGNLRTIDCPGDSACPVWPQAAAMWARRAQP
jgi:type IV secretory pathway VirB9-like protein